MALRVEVVEQGGTGAPDVQVAGGGRSESDARCGGHSRRGRIAGAVSCGQRSGRFPVP
ncbi:hypothetical protein D187_006046 [Cystobacter fuscus DSM 2262]|uniref:Uncharacterized protein n=1 Tax=Cystobacter fuscus (strain ATCC 25194 / DSM 2262 / NBRC 100088 / M29) TaxID=1242864 RepID=S9R439_CYSF2|nr:hypothetical protein D187_006046 [Cystobacter fuscus DSM 2262]